MTEIILILTKVAKTVGISPGLLVAVCMTETNLRNIDVMNDGGSPSYGVCQVKLETAKWMGKVHRKPAVMSFEEKDMRKVEKNAKVAALYLKYQINRYDGDYCKAVAAYNAGSFRESTKKPGLPFNWKYVEKVRNNGNERVQEKLECLEPNRQVASNNE